MLTDDNPLSPTAVTRELCPFGSLLLNSNRRTRLRLKLYSHRLLQPSSVSGEVFLLFLFVKKSSGSGTGSTQAHEYN
jgi:hypothetical protein